MMPRPGTAVLQAWDTLCEATWRHVYRQQPRHLGETMPRTIYKYPLPFREGWQEIRLPTDAIAVHVGEQPPGSGETLGRDDNGELHARLWLWAEVNPDKPVEVRRFLIIPTGVTIPRPPSGRPPLHLATVVTVSGALVWHVYEEPSW